MIDIIQYLGVFAVASFRIVPGASRLLNSFQSIKYIEPSVKILLEEFEPKNFSNLNKKNEENKSTLPLKFQKEINIKNLSFSYPSRKEFSLSKLSMSIKKGDFVGIIGETGSGKSTLINLIIGLLKPSQGEAKHPLCACPAMTFDYQQHEQLAYVPKLEPNLHLFQQVGF